jgi:hypothetical protein
MHIHDASISSSSLEVRNCPLAVSIDPIVHIPHCSGICRISWLESSLDCGTQTSRSSSNSRRLPPKCHDVCKLFKTARVQLEGDHAREIADCDQRGCRQLPFVLILYHSFKPRTCIYNLVLPCAFNIMSIRLLFTCMFCLLIGAH